MVLFYPFVSFDRLRTNGGLISLLTCPAGSFMRRLGPLICPRKACMHIKALCGGIAGGFVLGTLFFKGITLQAYKPFTVTDNLIPLEVLFGNPDRIRPQVSPDGTRLAYIAPYNDVLNVWVRTLGQTDDVVVTQDTGRGIRDFMWRYDNGGIIYSQDTKGDENWHVLSTDIATQKTTDFTPFAQVQARMIAYTKKHPHEMLIALNKDDKALHDVYRLNLATGELTLVVKNPGGILGFHADDDLQVRAATKMLPDGGRAIMLRKHAKAKWHELIRWNVEDASNESSGFIDFELAGKGVYIKDAADSNTARIVRMDSSSKKKTVIAQEALYDVDTLMLHPDTKEPIAATFIKERKQWLVLDKAYEQDFAVLQTLDRGDLNIINYDNAFNLWIVGFIKDDGPVAYYAYNRATKQALFLFHHQQSLAHYKLATRKPISYTTRDGLTVHGYLTMPAGAHSAKPPMVLLVHGGPWARDTWGFDAAAQLFANRGMSCLQVNYRGSTGYGKQFKQAGNKQWGCKMHDDLVDAVVWAVAQGYANEKKIAIFGGSYGGYAALVGATCTPDVFCCAVDIVGPSNLLTFLETIPAYWGPYKAQLYQQVGDPISEQEMLKERSPLFKAHAITIPMLIAQGANDPRVKQAESEQIVAALKENNITHQYMLFEDEGHGFAKPENRLKFYAAAEKFLLQHMCG